MISVVIPVFNQMEYLSDAIESVLNQTNQDFELIVVNDGSTDASCDVAKLYSRAKVISQVNKGLPAARNTGIMNAKGEYVFFHDSDDILYDTCLEKVQKRIDETGADIIAPSFKNFGVVNNDVILIEKPTLKDFTTANRIGHFCAVKRGALLECGGYSPRMIWGYEDYALWFDLLSRGKTLSVIQEPLVMHRIRENSMLTDANRHHEELMNQIKKDFPQAFQ